MFFFKYLLISIFQLKIVQINLQKNVSTLNILYDSILDRFLNVQICCGFFV
jgi:hypothetical protein